MGFQGDSLAAMPIFLECDRCTACCRWPGQVRVTNAEIGRLAARLELPERDFIARYTRLNANRSGLALTDQPNGACVFLDGDSCRVNPVKPQQCRDFPNLWSYPGAGKLCRAKPVEVNAEEWRRRIRQATGRDQAPTA
jgi:Fe-S-cluster containining protein